MSVYLLIEEIYYVVAIFISHYAYKIFKSYSQGNGLMFNNNQPPEGGQGARYQALREDLGR